MLGPDGPEMAFVCRSVEGSLGLCLKLLRPPRAMTLWLKRGSTKTIKMLSLPFLMVVSGFLISTLVSLVDLHGHSFGLLLSKPFQLLTCEGCEGLNFPTLSLGHFFPLTS